jgi:hypothetical protein
MSFIRFDFSHDQFPFSIYLAEMYVQPAGVLLLIGGRGIIYP